MSADSMNADAERFYRSGLRYRSGDGVEQDLEKAFHCFKEAAESGMPSAEYRLANCYLYAEGVDEDPDEAFKWYVKAVDDGCPDAMFALGQIHYYGVLKDPDYPEAFRLFSEGAKLGNGMCQIYLGDMYRKGEGTERSPPYAVDSYRSAAEQGLSNAIGRLGCYYPGGGKQFLDLLSIESTPEDACRGNVISYYLQGLGFEFGFRQEQSLQQAIDCYRTAAESDDADAQYHLGVCLCNLGFAEIDEEQSRLLLEESVQWLNRAANNGNEHASVCLRSIKESEV